jgi:RNA polymerase sigma-70 factor, ECF subfamily
MNPAANPTASALFSLRVPAVRTVENASTSKSGPGDIESLTRRLAALDEKAFAEFHARYFDSLYQFLLVLNQGREDEAQEALQQTLLRVVRYVRPFQSEEIFWCWLKGVARSVVRDAARKQRRYWGVLDRFSRWRESAPSNSVDPVESLRAELDESLCGLSSEDRLLLVGKYIDGAKLKELASQTGLTEKAIESRLLRLRRRLREKLLKKLNSS